MSRTVVRKTAHRAWFLFFSSGSLLVAAYAFTIACKSTAVTVSRNGSDRNQ